MRMLRIIMQCATVGFLMSCVTSGEDVSENENFNDLFWQSPLLRDGPLKGDPQTGGVCGGSGCKGSAGSAYKSFRFEDDGNTNGMYKPLGEVDVDIIISEMTRIAREIGFSRPISVLDSNGRTRVVIGPKGQYVRVVREVKSHQRAREE